MKKQVMDEKAMLAGQSYEEDKPWSCKYCYFWEGKKRGCGLDECYYLISDSGDADQPKPDKVGNCEKCPYGKQSPCIGYCIERIYYDIVIKRRKERANGRDG